MRMGSERAERGMNPLFTQGAYARVNERTYEWFYIADTCKKERNKLMAENRTGEAALNVARIIHETNQAVAQSTIAAQERNIRFAQSVFENGIEVLKSHAEGTRSLMHAAEAQQDPQEVLREVMTSTAAAQERNIKFAQSVFENGVEVLKSNAESTRSLMQTVVKQTQEQQEALWTQPFVEAYLNVLSAPFTYYKQALETAQSVTGQAMDIAQKTARQGMEAVQQAAQQGMEHAQSAMGQKPPTAE